MTYLSGYFLPWNRDKSLKKNCVASLIRLKTSLGSDYGFTWIVWTSSPYFARSCVAYSSVVMVGVERTSGSGRQRGSELFSPTSTTVEDSGRNWSHSVSPSSSISHTDGLMSSCLREPRYWRLLFRNEISRNALVSSYSCPRFRSAVCHTNPGINKYARKPSKTNKS